MTLKKYAIVVTVLLAATWIVACGGSHSNGGGGTIHTAKQYIYKVYSNFAFGGANGTIIGAPKAKTAEADNPFSLITRANAQTTTTTVNSQTLEGLCVTTRPDGTVTPADGRTGAGLAIPVFRLGGGFGSPAAGICGSDRFTYNDAGGAGPVSAAGDMASTGRDGGTTPIAFNGTLATLDVTGDNYSPDPNVSAPVGKDASGKIRVFVIRNGSALDTGLICTLGVNRHCTDITHTFAAQTGDKVAAFVEAIPGDYITNLTVHVTVTGS